MGCGDQSDAAVEDERRLTRSTASDPRRAGQCFATPGRARGDTHSSAASAVSRMAADGDKTRAVQAEPGDRAEAASTSSRHRRSSWMTKNSWTADPPAAQIPLKPFWLRQCLAQQGPVRCELKRGHRCVHAARTLSGVITWSEGVRPEDRRKSCWTGSTDRSAAVGELAVNRPSVRRCQRGRLHEQRDLIERDVRQVGGCPSRQRWRGRAPAGKRRPSHRIATPAFVWPSMSGSAPPWQPPGQMRFAVTGIF